METERRGPRGRDGAGGMEADRGEDGSQGWTPWMGVDGGRKGQGWKRAKPPHPLSPPTPQPRAPRPPAHLSPLQVAPHRPLLLDLLAAPVEQGEEEAGAGEEEPADHQHRDHRGGFPGHGGTGLSSGCCRAPRASHGHSQCGGDAPAPLGGTGVGSTLQEGTGGLPRAPTWAGKVPEQRGAAWSSTAQGSLV